MRSVGRWYRVTSAIDDVKIWNKPLSDAEPRSLASVPIHGP